MLWKGGKGDDVAGCNEDVTCNVKNLPGALAVLFKLQVVKAGCLLIVGVFTLDLFLTGAVMCLRLVR